MKRNELVEKRMKGHKERGKEEKKKVGMIGNKYTRNEEGKERSESEEERIQGEVKRTNKKI